MGRLNTLKPWLNGVNARQGKFGNVLRWQTCDEWPNGLANTSKSQKAISVQSRALAPS